MFTYLIICRLFASFLRSNVLYRVESVAIRLAVSFGVFSSLFTVNLRPTIGVIRVLSTQSFTYDNIR